MRKLYLTCPYCNKQIPIEIADGSPIRIDHKEIKDHEEELWCPHCGQKDTSNNTVNGHPTCMRVLKNGKLCLHRLVSKEASKEAEG